MPVPVVPMLIGILALCVVPAAAAAAPSTDPGIHETVKNPEETGGARIVPDNPKAAPTTGSDIDGRGTDVDGHGYSCIAMKLRRQDGGITKVRKCND